MVPAALGLACSKTRGVVDRDCDMYLNSGLTISIHDEKSGKMVGTRGEQGERGRGRGRGKEGERKWMFVYVG
jgi:hypothetical protein